MTLMKQKEPKEPKRRIALIMNVLFISVDYVLVAALFVI